VRSTDSTFVDFVDTYLAGFRSPDELEEPAMLSADAGVAKTLPGNVKVEPKMTLYFGTTAIYRGFSHLEMAGRLIRFVRNNGLRFKNDFIRLGAGSVVVDGSAVLLLGGRDHRVAALSAKLVERGASLLGDDVTLWEPVDRLVHPTGLPITLEVDLAHAAFPEIVPAHRRRRGRDQKAIPRVWPVPLKPEDLGGAHALEPAVIGRVLVVEFRDEGPTTLDPIGLGEAVFAGSGSVANLEVWGERSLIALRELYETAPFLRLVTSSIDDAADAVQRALPHMESAS
jgi:hypothetical protein